MGFREHWEPLWGPRAKALVTIVLLCYFLTKSTSQRISLQVVLNIIQLIYYFPRNPLHCYCYFIPWRLSSFTDFALHILLVMDSVILVLQKQIINIARSLFFFIWLKYSLHKKAKYSFHIKSVHVTIWTENITDMKIF